VPPSLDPSHVVGPCVVFLGRKLDLAVPDFRPTPKSRFSDRLLGESRQPNARCRRVFWSVARSSPKLSIGRGEVGTILGCSSDGRELLPGPETNRSRNNFDNFSRFGDVTGCYTTNSISNVDEGILPSYTTMMAVTVCNRPHSAFPVPTSRTTPNRIYRRHVVMIPIRSNLEASLLGTVRHTNGRGCSRRSGLERSSLRLTLQSAHFVPSYAGVGVGNPLEGMGPRTD